jgi:hypothetical protein
MARSSSICAVPYRSTGIFGAGDGGPDLLGTKAASLFDVRKTDAPTKSQRLPRRRTKAEAISLLNPCASRNQRRSPRVDGDGVLHPHIARTRARTPPRQGPAQAGRRRDGSTAVFLAVLAVRRRNHPSVTCASLLVSDSTTRWAAWPSPKTSGRLSGLKSSPSHALRVTSTFQPASTAPGHSVFRAR